MLKVAKDQFMGLLFITSYSYQLHILNGRIVCLVPRINVVFLNRPITVADWPEQLIGKARSVTLSGGL